VELVFEYDSDWSDLADDEDPDSNDERFEGNDYPDEGAGEMGGVRHFTPDEKYRYSLDIYLIIA
jgi:hypothetical protein